MRRLPRASVAIILWLLVACAAAAPASAAGVRVGAAPQLPAGASFAGAIAPERPLELEVALEPRDPTALEAFAEEVATPGSPRYGDFLSVPEFAARFAPTPAQVATVRSALVARGLQAGTPSANDLSLPITATAATAEAAFDTAIDRVETSSGRVAFANRSAPQVPTAAAPFVQGVLGLDDLHLSHRQIEAPAAEPGASPGAAATAAFPGGPTTSVLTGGPQPCATALAHQQKHGGYTADQVAAAYGLAPFYAAGDFGAGQTIALLEMEPTLPEDVALYQACYGNSVELTQVEIEGGPGPWEPEDDGESALDMEQLIGLAPGAKILVYEGPNPSETALLSAWVSDDAAKVMSSSWGLCEKETGKAEMAVTDTLLQEAAAQGQSFFVAAGDEGSTDCYESEGPDKDKSLQVDFPGSDPFATDVGGTEMEAPTTPPLQYIWNRGEDEEGAGGGGISTHFPMPAYQQAANPALNVLGPLSSGSPCGFAGYCRQVPDVSANAAPYTGYIVHTEQKWQVTGGTSAAAPLWAAFTALTQASPACGGRAIGFANPALYAIAGSAYAADFDDVTAARPGGPPTTNIFSSTLPYAPGPGYDMATGIGTPIGSSLGASLCALLPPVTAAASPASAAPHTAAPAPTPARVLHARLAGVGQGRPRLVLSLAAREGVRIESVAVTVPPALLVATRARALDAGIVVRTESGARLKFSATSTPGMIRIRLRSPQPGVKLTVGFPALASTARLIAHIRAGRTHKLGLVVTTRESGAKGTRLPLTVPL